MSIGLISNNISGANKDFDSYFLRRDEFSFGSIWTSGTNIVGMVGDGTTINKSSPTQISSGGVTWKDVVGKYNTVGGIKTDGTLWLWGFNGFGVIGDNTTINRSVPIQATASTYFWKKVSLAGHILAIRSNGTLWAWGAGTSYELGDGTSVSKSSIIQIGTSNTWKEVEAGMLYSLAIKTDGTLWGWGYNTSGQIGDGTLNTKSTPVQIGTDTNWVKISAGIKKSYGIKSDGSLWAWGDNTNGYLSVVTPGLVSVPTQVYEYDSEGNVTYLYNWKDIDTNGADDTLTRTMAIREDGSLWTWGNNSLGQLGLGYIGGTVVNPTRVGNEFTWKNISCGYGGQGVAIKTDGTLWGSTINNSGELPGLTVGTTGDYISYTQIVSDKKWAKAVVVNSVFIGITESIY